MERHREVEQLFKSIIILFAHSLADPAQDYIQLTSENKGEVVSPPTLEAAAGVNSTCKRLENCSTYM